MPHALQAPVPYTAAMARVDAQINFRIPADLREQIDLSMEQSKNSLTGEIVDRLKRSFELEKSNQRLADDFRLLMSAHYATQRALAGQGELLEKLGAILEFTRQFTSTNPGEMPTTTAKFLPEVVSEVRKAAEDVRALAAEAMRPFEDGTIKGVTETTK